MSSGLVCLCKEASFTYPQVAVFARQVIYLFEHNNLSGVARSEPARKSAELLYDENLSNVYFGDS